MKAGLANGLCVAALGLATGGAAQETSLTLYSGGIVLPGDVPHVGLSTQGVSEVELRVHRLADPLAYFALGTQPTAPLRRFTFRVDRDVDRSWSEDTLALFEAGAAPGAYLVEATAGDKQARTIALVSGLRMVAKHDASGALVFLADAETGRPAAGVDIFAVREKSDTLPGPVARTSTLGIARIPGPVGAQPVSLYARRGADFVGVQGLYDRGQGVSAAEDFFKAEIETDRPLYRPGQEVHFKAILRVQQPDGRWRMPGRITVTATARDQGRRGYYREELAASDFGTVNGRFRLPREAALGHHVVEVQSGKWSWSAWFRVEEYRKPTFRVQVQSDRSECAPGDPLKIRIAASYYSGEPVAGAPVDYELYWIDVARAWWSYYDEARPESRAGERVGGGQGMLDASGQLEVQLEAPGRARPGLLRVVAHATDAANRRVAGAGIVQLSPGEGAFAIALDTEDESTAGRPFLFTLKTSQNDVPVSRPLKLRVTRVRWVTNEQRRYEQRIDSVQEAEARTDASGRTTLRIVPEGEGSYCLDAAGEDARGRRFEERHCVWIPQSQRWWTPYKSLALEPDQRRYAPGGVARLRLRSPVEEGTVLFTVEGPSLFEHRVLPLTGGLATIPVAIEKAFSPSVNVSAVLVSRGRFYQAETYLFVPPTDRYLDVAVRTDREAYEPGETAQVEVRVTDAEGRPAQAELSLKAVDEAIYALSPDNVARIEGVFYGTRYTEVATHTSRWDAPRPQASMSVVMPEPTDGDVPDGRVRKRFVDTLFWEASARSGPDGVVRVRFPVADNLTSWRVLARGADRETRVGQGAAQFRSSRPVTVRLGLPRFVGEGDRAAVSATVHNATERSIESRVRLRATGVDLEGAGERSVNLQAGGTATLGWSYTARAAGTARFAVSVVAGDANDAEEIELPVHRHGLELVESTSRVLAKERDAARFPPAPASPDEVGVELSPSLAGPALAGVEYLLRYPYGCVEQTLSAFLPAVLVAGSLRDLGAADEGQGGKLDPRALAREGLRRLYGFQNREGGWGWWGAGVSDGFMTAYVLYGLAQARRAGLEVDEKVLESAIAAARALLGGQKQEKPLAPAVRASLLQALAEAGAADEAATRDLFEGRERDGGLSAAARALLTLALARQGDRQRAGEALAELLAAAERREGLVWWPAPPREARSWREDDVVATALAVQAILAVSPERPEADAAVRWLMAHRLGAGQWRSTLDTALVLYALADHMRARREATSAFGFEIVSAGKVLWSGRFAPGDLLREPRRFSVPAAALGKPLELRKRGRGTLYATLTRRSFTGGEPVAATARGGVSLERSYVRLRPERGSDGALTYKREPLGSDAEVASGDLLLVVLAARLPAESEYFMLEDRLPSGFEVVGRPEGIDAAAGEQDEQSLDRLELRDDRVAFFVGSAKGGAQRWSYVLRAEAAGAYHVPPAQAALMYYPETRATSAEARIRVR